MAQLVFRVPPIDTATINPLYVWFLYSVLMAAFVPVVRNVVEMAVSHVLPVKVSDRFAVSYNLPWPSKYS